jgi:hypothetical protein
MAFPDNFIFHTNIYVTTVIFNITELYIYHCFLLMFGTVPQYGTQTSTTQAHTTIITTKQYLSTQTTVKKTIRCNTFSYRNNNPVVTGYQNSH